MTFTFQKYTKKQKTVLSAVVAMVAITVILMFCKCFSDHRYSKVLVSADSLCDCNPDSAVVLLKKIKLTSSMDEADSMYCELLKIKASNNLYEIQKDSTIFRIVEFFDDMGDKEKLCQAYYYQGKYYMEHSDAPHALKCMQSALDNADENTKKSFYSRIYCQIGNIFFDQALYSDALEMYKKTYTYDFVQRDTVNMVHSLRDMSQAYKYLNKLDSCELLLKRAFAMSIAFKGTGVHESIALALASLYSDIGKYSMARVFLTKLNIDDYDGLKSPAYSILTRIYDNEGKKDSVYLYSKKLLSFGTVYSKIYASRKLVSYYCSKGNVGEVKKYVGIYWHSCISPWQYNLVIQRS